MDNNPNAKIPEAALEIVMEAFQQDQTAKQEAERFTQEHRQESRPATSMDTPETATAEPVADEVLLIKDKSETAPIVEREVTTKDIAVEKEGVEEKPAEKTKNFHHRRGHFRYFYTG